MARIEFKSFQEAALFSKNLSITTKSATKVHREGNIWWVDDVRVDQANVAEITESIKVNLSQNKHVLEYDEDGFDSDGFDNDGFNRLNINRNGIRRDDLAVLQNIPKGWSCVTPKVKYIDYSNEKVRAQWGPDYRD